MMKEIPGLNGVYFCDMSGNVYNKHKKLSPFIGNGNYERITLGNKKYTIHRLIAQTYLENPDNKPYVDHIDRNTLNNNLSNLRWVTGRENNLNRKLKKKESISNGTTPRTSE